MELGFCKAFPNPFIILQFYAICGKIFSQVVVFNKTTILCVFLLTVYISTDVISLFNVAFHRCVLRNTVDLNLLLLVKHV